jgi:hypothetical protein
MTSVGQRVDQLEEVQRREGLREEEVRAGGAGLGLRLAAGRREHDDRAVGDRPQLAAGLDAVHARHVDVEEDDRRVARARGRDRLDAVAGLVDVEARDVLERSRDEAADERVVVDDQDRTGQGAPPMPARSSSKRSSLTLCSASTEAGQNCVPAPASMTARASANVPAGR